jgi:hypothetical protein
MKPRMWCSWQSSFCAAQDTMARMADVRLEPDIIHFGIKVQYLSDSHLTLALQQL